MDEPYQPTAPNSMGGFIKMMRTPDLEELVSANPLAFTLATMIALRARLRPEVSPLGLHQGEAFLGDFAKCGMSRQQYRTAMRQLSEWGFARFRATNRGTVGTLINTRLFDVLSGLSNQRLTNGATIGQPLSKNNRRRTEEEKDIPAPSATGAIRKPAEVRPGKAAEPSDFVTFRDGWMAGYEAQFGARYLFAPAKDGMAIKRLLVVDTPQALLETARRAWANRDGFHSKRAASIAGFAAALNDIRAELSKTAPTTKTTKDF
jgi:hypothetical protein